MARDRLQYRYYPDSGKSEITIPRLLIKAGKLNWEDKDILEVEIETINGNKGLFIYKKEAPSKKKIEKNKS